MKTGEPKQEETFDLRVFLSTDGKHTIEVSKANSTSKERKEMLAKAMDAYDFVVKRYGTKQGQAVKEYGKESKDKVDQDKCDHSETTFKQSKTEKNPGRWFKQCIKCGKFMGWRT